jgi:hypothetical protein
VFDMLLAQNLVEYGLLDVMASAVVGAANWLTTVASFHRDSVKWLAVLGVLAFVAMKIFSRR